MDRAIDLPSTMLFALVPAGRLGIGLVATLIVTTLGLALASAITIVASAGLTVDFSGFARFLALALGMLILAAWCRWRYPDPRLANAAAIVGAGSLSLMLCGVISNAGLRLGVPLADGWLATTDAAFGFHVGRTVRAMSAHPLLIDCLSLVYNASGIAVIVAIGFSLLKARVRHARELAGTAIVSMQLVAITSLMFPAWGAMRYFGLETLQGHGLPLGAGVYQWPAFEHFYLGSDITLRLADMGGVVAFPSFHTVLALIVTQALADTRWRWAGVAWTVGVIVSAVPMGGHYVADLAAGAMVWLIAATLARRVSSPSA